MTRLVAILLLLSQTSAWAGSSTLIKGDILEASTSGRIGTTGAPDSRSVLDLVSTTKSFLPPRMTTTQRDAISSPPEGSTIENTTTHTVDWYNGSAWRQVASLTDITTASTSTNASFYPLFVASSSNSVQAFNLGTGLTFNPSTNNLSTTTFTGDLAGNATSATTATSATSATNATNTAITDDTTTNATMYPTWVTTASSNQAQKVSSTKLTFNPSTATLTTTTFSGAVTGHSSLDLALTGGTMSGAIAMGTSKITGMGDPTAAQDAATKSYVDAQLLQLNPADAVYAASSGSNIAGTYVNAVSGVCIGDTFTTTATTAFALDGTSPAVGARVLLKDQTNSYQDGVWTLTTQAVGGVSGAVLTRALDFDSSADINAGQIIPVIAGTVNAGSSWFQTATNTTCNSSTQTWTQFQKAAAAYLLVASNLSDVASSSTSFNNLSGLTTLGDMIYGGASGTRSRLAGNTSTTVQLLSQTGDGVASAAPAWLSAVSTNTASKVVLRDGSGNFSAGTVTAQVTGTASGNTTYTANNHGVVVSGSANAMTVIAPDSSTTKAFVSGGSSADPSWATLAIGGGGTGQTTKAAAFDALQPMTTSGDVIYGGASGTGTRLAKGNNGDILTLASGLPSWAAPSAATVYAWAGYHKQDCSWSRTNTSYGSPTADASCTFTELTNTNFGTVSSDSSAGNKLPGITFTCPATGSYFFSANMAAQGPATAGVTLNYKLTDGTTVWAERFRQTENTSQNITPVSLTGIMTCTGSSTVTLTIQSKSDSGAQAINAPSTNNTSIDWAIHKIN